MALRNSSAPKINHLTVLVEPDRMTPFAEAYDASDWSEFAHLPAFEATHRRNAYGIYLSLERESFNSG